TNSYTYSLGRYYNVPKLFRGMFIRGQMTYLPGLEKFEETELQISRNFMQTGRVQFTFGHNFIGNFNSLSLNFTIDFNKIRSNTTSRTSGSEISITQNFRGSIGYDPYGDQLLLNNRQQVGQSGTAVRLFVDNNNDGFYEDSTDQVITDPAVHLNRAGGRTTVKNGINYISQLLPYYRYDMEINKEALSNPMLVPDIENFSIVTDPNQYKTIEIPFYQSGVISGNVAKKQDSTFKALSGVRLFLESNYEKESSRKPFSKELRTFSDGSFYTYEIPPGRYHLYIDPKQLEFLDAISKPDTMDITIKSLAEGDFVENLNFTVVPNVDTTQNSQPAFSQQSHTSNEQPDEKEIADQQYYYEIQLASFKTLEKAESVASEASKHLGGSFTVTLNTNNGLYAIRSTPIPEREDALETIISYYNSNYSGAALVVLNNNYEKSTVKPEFIQLGTFSTIQQACAFARSSAKELKKELAITKNLDSGQYKVYINESYPSDQSIESQLAKIKGTIPFSDAYINHEHQIQIGAFKNLHTARTFAHNSQILLNRTLNVTKDAEEEYYKVVIDSSYTSQTTRDKTLAQVKQTAVFHDASINSSNGDSIILHKGRPMKFTYRVQVEGVTKESEDTYLSEVLDSASDTDLEQPRKETVIFDNVTTWNKTLKLQKKLAKISTVGHPIIILIEESRTEN
ncbi:MAG: SPOR domain-containing protein, partial [Balneolaceae bacterium]